MRDFIPSGRFAQLARLSRKALRLYAEIGLLRPAHINPETNYRYYRLSQLEDAHRIGKLRELGMPLENVRDALRVWGTNKFSEKLEAHRESLLQQAATVQTALGELEQLLNTPPQHYTVQLKPVLPYRYLGTRAWCDPDDACSLIDEAQQRLLETAQQALLEVTGPSLARYHDERDDAWDVEVCLPVAGHTGFTLPQAVYESEAPEGLAAFTVHTGDCGGSRGLQDAYKAVWLWLREHGHETCGGPYEVYVFDEHNTADPADYRTEVAWLLR